MRLYDVLHPLLAGKHLHFQGADGTTAVIDVEITVTGALYTVLRAHTTDTMGHPRGTSRGYTISARAECRPLDQSLRDLGMDPDKYSIV